MTKLLKKLIALHRENRRLRALLDGRWDDAIRLNSINMTPGEIKLEMEGGPIGAVASQFAKYFETCGGDERSNYVEMHLTHEKLGPFILTMQRRFGKTPHELRVLAERERDELKGMQPEKWKCEI